VAVCIRQLQCIVMIIILIMMIIICTISISKFIKLSFIARIKQNNLAQNRHALIATLPSLLW